MAKPKTKKKGKKETPEKAEWIRDVSQTQDAIVKSSEENARLRGEIELLTKQIENLDPANPGWARLEQSLRSLARARPNPPLATYLMWALLLALSSVVAYHTLSNKRSLSTMLEKLDLVENGRVELLQAISTAETVAGDRRERDWSQLVKQISASMEKTQTALATLERPPRTAPDLSQLDRSVAGLEQTRADLRTLLEELERRLAEGSRLTSELHQQLHTVSQTAIPLANLEANTHRLEDLVRKAEQVVTPLSDSMPLLDSAAERLARQKTVEAGELQALRSIPTLDTRVRDIASDLDAVGSNLQSLRAEVLDLRESLQLLRESIEPPSREEARDGKRVDY